MEPGAGDAERGGLFINLVSSSHWRAQTPYPTHPSRTIRVGVDSCAAVSVTPVGLVPEIEAVQDNEEPKTYYSCNRQEIKDEGEKRYMGRIRGVGGVIRGRFRAAQVHRTLMSVSDMVDKGVRVVFDKENGKDVSHFVIKKTGRRVALDRTNRVYDFPLELDIGAVNAQPLAGEVTSPGNWRRGSRP